ncbi:MAG: hypothetical protein O2954_01315 [bacterium]|nr:hypothetical protein [bacterium]
MASVVLEEILEEVKALSPGDQRALREALDHLLKSTSSQSKETELERKLLEKGLVKKITPPVTDLTPYQNRKPVQLKGKGKTASELIIEDRQ